MHLARRRARRTLAKSAPGRVTIISMARMFTDCSSKFLRVMASFFHTCSTCLC